MTWCVVFFYVATHQPVDVPSVCGLTKLEAEHLAHDPENYARGYYGVLRPQ
jgi:hypothetical protein